MVRESAAAIDRVVHHAVVLEFLGHVIEVFLGAQLRIDAQGIGDIVAMRAAAAGFVSRGGIQVGNAQVAQVRNQVASIDETEALVELYAVRGARSGWRIHAASGSLELVKYS